MQYSNYLIHFNKNHSSKNGQFTSGDGDGDGRSNDHAWNKRERGKVYRAMNDREIYNITRTIGSNSPKSAGSVKTSGTKNVDDAKLSGSQYKNASMRFNIQKAINKASKDGSLVAGGSSFFDAYANATVDDQKLSNTEAGMEQVRRNLGYAMIDLTEEDEEEKKKKKKKITQSHWGKNRKNMKVSK